MNDFAPTGLTARGLTLRYGERVIAEHLSLSLPNAGFTAIVGPNACGKSTLLRAFARLLLPDAGSVVLDGRNIAALPAKELARSLGLLPQSALPPDGITAADLVARGRYPHQSWLRQWSRSDEAAIGTAMRATGTTELGHRQVDELSGGQRQRVWLAMVLAQETPILLLDEPTTFLDIAHQIDLLDLLADLNAEGRTVVAVLHDLNQAARYASHLVAMKDGAVVAEGPPGRIVTAELVETVFGLPCVVVADPVTGTPLVVPKGRKAAAIDAPPSATPAPAPVPADSSPAAGPAVGPNRSGSSSPAREPHHA